MADNGHVSALIRSAPRLSWVFIQGFGPPSTGSGATVFVEQRPCYERFFLQKLHIILAGRYVVRSHEALYLWPYLDAM